MATVIRRSSAIGDPTQARIPFPEPGPQPVLRLSALNVANVDGDILTSVPTVEGSNTATGSLGDPVEFSVPQSGVPAFKYDSSDTVRPTLANNGAPGRIIRSQLVIARVHRHANVPSTTNRNSDIILTSCNNGLATSISISSTQHETLPGRLRCRGGNSQVVWGPEVSLHDLHFFALVVDGTTAHLTLDGVTTSGPVGAVTAEAFFSGYTLCGGAWETVEAAQYTDVLSPEQVEVKRSHYRALYQF